MRLARTALFILIASAAGYGYLPAHAGGAPAETPPPDFTGRQYIDSTGCVFLKHDSGGWRARIDSQGVAVCGYPPTPVDRGMGGRHVRVWGEEASLTANLASLGSLDPDSDIAGSETGAPDRTASADSGPERGATGTTGNGASAPGMPANLAHQLEAAITTAPRIAAASAMAVRDSRLCEMIGAEARPDDGKGTTSMMGYCGASIIDTAARPKTVETDPPLTPRTETAGVAPQGEDPPHAAQAGLGEPPPASKTTTAGGKPSQSDESRSTTTQRPKVTAGKKPVQPATSTPPAKKVGSVDSHPVTSPGLPSPDMIPAGARYFVISRHPDSTSAGEAARRLALAGFPAAIGTTSKNEQRTLLAGPFQGREAMVRARLRLLRAGFTLLSAH